MNRTGALLAAWIGGAPVLAAPDAPSPAPAPAVGVPGPLPAAGIKDPTKVTPAFEKSYRELAAQFQPQSAKSAAPTPRPPLPEVRLLGRIAGAGLHGDTVMLQVGDATVTARVGEEASFSAHGQMLRVKPYQSNAQEVHVVILPHNETFILR